MNKLSNEEISRQSIALITVLDNWGVSNAQKVVMLALPSGTKPRAILRYQQGASFPVDEVIQERIEHFFGIAEALRLAYPRNSQGGELWLKRPNKHFNQRTPLSVMIEDGLAGIIAVRMRIDCSYDWFIDEQQSKKDGNPS